MAIEYHAQGREPVGVAQPHPYAADYPIIQPSSDIKYLLADAYFAYANPADINSPAGAYNNTRYVAPFRIDWLYGFGDTTVSAPSGVPTPTHAADARIRDATGAVAFDSTTATYRVIDWGGRLRIHEWVGSTAVLRLVQHTKWAPADANIARNYSTHIAPTSAQLEPRTIDLRPPQLFGVRVLATQINNEAFVLKSGFNIQIKPQIQTVGNRAVTRIEFSAVAGAGAGVFTECDTADRNIYRINNISPTETGHFKIAAASCYKVSKPLLLLSQNPRRFTATANTLRFSSECPPCYSCDDVIDLARRLDGTGRKYLALSSQTRAVREVYRDNRERWIKAAECLTRRKIRLQLVPQLCPYLTVAMQYCNMTANCLADLQLTIALTSTGNTAGVIVPNFTLIRGASMLPGRKTGRRERYTMGGTWPSFTAAWPSVQAYSSVDVVFRLMFAECGQVADVPITVDGVVSGTIAGREITVVDDTGATVRATGRDRVTLDCPATSDDFAAIQVCL